MSKFNKSQSKQCKVVSIDTIYEDGKYSKSIIVVSDENDNQYTIEDGKITEQSSNSEIKDCLINQLTKIDKIEPIVVEIKSNQSVIDKKIDDL